MTGLSFQIFQNKITSISTKTSICFIQVIFILDCSQINGMHSYKNLLQRNCCFVAWLGIKIWFTPNSQELHYLKIQSTVIRLSFTCFGVLNYIFSLTTIICSKILTDQIHEWHFHSAELKTVLWQRLRNPIKKYHYFRVNHQNNAKRWNLIHFKLETFGGHDIYLHKMAAMESTHNFSNVSCFSKDNFGKNGIENPPSCAFIFLALRTRKSPKLK